MAKEKSTNKVMTEVRTREIPLKWDVFVTPGIPMVTSDLASSLDVGARGQTVIHPIKTGELICVQ